MTGRTALGSLMLLLMLGAVGCTKTIPPAPEEVNGTSFTYIRLRLPGKLVDHVAEVQAAYDLFRRRHPDQRITKDFVDYDNGAYPGWWYIGPMVEGVAIYHEPCGCIPPTGP